MAECWHETSLATRRFEQQRPSFHGDRCAGSAAPGMLNADLGPWAKNEIPTASHA